jgi:hypothetical protein
MTKPSILFAAGALALVGSAGLAHADTVTLHSAYKREGTWREVGDGPLVWSGTYWFFGFNETGGGFGQRLASTCPATVMVAAGIARYVGFCVKTDPDGDQIFSSVQGVSAPDEPFAGNEVYISGTGKYEGIKGEGDFTCDAVGPDEQGYCEHHVTYTLP